MSQIAKCLVDSDVSISSFAQQFFVELSKKSNNPIYNVMASTLGKLVIDDTIDADSFSKISTVLLKFVDKERHIEALIEKLFTRVADLEDETHACLFISCISLLKIDTEKAVKKVISCFPYYKQKLTTTDGFRESFILLVSNLEKIDSLSMDTTSQLEDIRKYIEQIKGNSLDTIVPTFHQVKTSRKIKRMKSIKEDQENQSGRANQATVKRTMTRKKKIKSKSSDGDDASDFDFE